MKKEEFITFSTAKLAKEKEFPQEYYPYYNEQKNIIIHSITKPFGLMYYASSQSQLQKWLREEHEIHICVTLECIGSDEWEYSYNIIYLPKDEMNEKRRSSKFQTIYSFNGAGSSYIGAWETYEEALEEAFLPMAITLSVSMSLVGPAW